jgi:Mg-chelatase subunit ChlD
MHCKGGDNQKTGKRTASFIDLGFAREISNEPGARYMKLEELRAQDIVDGIRDIGM